MQGGVGLLAGDIQVDITCTSAATLEHNLLNKKYA
jgi:hypothetical protein